MIKAFLHLWDTCQHVEGDTVQRVQDNIQKRNDSMFWIHNELLLTKLQD